MRHCKLLVPALVALLAGAWAPAFGQSDRGAITGTIKDPKGGVVPDAKVTATNLESGEVREARTTGEGTYILPELKAAPYRLRVEATGFKTATIDKIQVGVQITRHADVTLELGSISESVTVSSDAPVLQTDSPVQQLNVSERQVRELPLVVSAESGGRSPLAFIFLDSSVTPNGPTSNGTNATNFRINGSQGLGQDILIDGAGTRRGENGTFFSEVAPGPNAFQEFTINSSNYSAEFGNSSGGVINFTIKSGGNDFHGEGYLFLINEALNANIALNRLTGLPRPRDRQKDFGFAVGGPVILPGLGNHPFYDGRNKTFFFFNYGGYRTNQSEAVDIGVPTERMRRGDFGELLTDPYVTGFFGAPVQIFDPRQPAGQRQAFPNNIVPPDAIDPAGQKFVNLFPLPNETGPRGSTVFHNYRAASTAVARTNYYVGLYYAPLFYNANGQDGLLGYAAGQVNINGGLDAFITLSNYPKLPLADPNAQYVGQLDRNDIDFYDKNYKLGRTAQYDVSLQRQLPYNVAVSLSYMGNKGTRLRSGFVQLNALPLEALKLGNALLTTRLADVTAEDRAYAASVGVTLPATADAVYAGFNGAGGRFSGTVAQALRSFPQYGPINNRLESQGQSWYNAFKVDLQRRFTKGIQFGASYTFAKLLTNAAEDLYGASPLTGVLQNPADRRSLRSLSPNDVKHSLVCNYLIELPFGKGKRFLNQGGLVDRLVGGFQVSGIQRYRSGTPLTPLIAGGQRDFLDLFGVGGNLRPNLTGQPFFLDQAAQAASLNASGGVNYRVLNTAAFSRPPSYTGTSAPIGSPEYRAYYADPLRFFGNAAPTYGNLRTLAFYAEDFSILKKTRITETTLFEIRAEFFNLFNRSRFGAPDTNLDNPGNFGIQSRFSDIFQPRRIQLGARFLF